MYFLRKDETIIRLTTKEIDELELYGFVIIERSGFMFFVTKGKKPLEIIAVLVNYIII